MVDKKDIPKGNTNSERRIIKPGTILKPDPTMPKFVTPTLPGINIPWNQDIIDKIEVELAAQGKIVIEDLPSEYELLQERKIKLEKNLEEIRKELLEIEKRLAQLEREQLISLLEFIKDKKRPGRPTRPRR